MAVDAGPCQVPATKPEVIDEKDCAADPNSAAKPSHADAAANIGAEPAPAYIKSELISGGNTKKLIPRASFPAKRHKPGGRSQLSAGTANFMK
jgi:hypothetical protein